MVSGPFGFFRTIIELFPHAIQRFEDYVSDLPPMPSDWPQEMKENILKVTLPTQHAISSGAAKKAIALGVAPVLGVIIFFTLSGIAINTVS